MSACDENVNCQLDYIDIFLGRYFSKIVFWVSVLNVLIQIESKNSECP